MNLSRTIFLALLFISLSVIGQQYVQVFNKLNKGIDQGAAHCVSPASAAYSVTTNEAGELTVWEKLMKGVNQDASIPTGANFEKVIHEAGHMQTIHDAGFNSVRFFIAYALRDFTKQQQRIQDALDNDLAVIICML